MSQKTNPRISYPIKWYKFLTHASFFMAYLVVVNEPLNDSGLLCVYQRNEQGDLKSIPYLYD